MKTIKVADAIGPALDWLVASLLGYTNPRFHREPPLEGGWIMDPPRKAYGAVLLADYAFSTDWAQGGPIIESERMQLFYATGVHWSAHIWKDGNFGAFGPTPLIAAMRCFVASKLGEEVSVPEELL